MTTATATPRLLLVSRQPEAALRRISNLAGNSYSLCQASSAREALERLQTSTDVELALFDLAFRDTDYLQALERLRKIRPDLPVVLLSRSENGPAIKDALLLGGRDNVLRPVSEKQLRHFLQSRISTTTRDPTKAFGTDQHVGDDVTFIATSPVMRRIRSQAELLAKMDVPILIAGESGTGKELVARLIHDLSARSGYRFLKLTCAALSTDLFETELFDGEETMRNGTTTTDRFELCDKGTILFDDIDEMSPALQAKLLYLLQDPRPLQTDGDSTPHVDVRILATIGVNIEKALLERKLREDLYYRLAAFTLQLPPLRERKDELHILFTHFVNRIARHYELPARPLAAGLLESCKHYSWPGNLRELENCAKRYVVMGDEQAMLAQPGLKAVNERAEVHQTGLRSGVEKTARDVGGDTKGLKTLVRSVRGQAERSAILSMLEKTRWNRKEAARLLGISYRGLLYKIEQYQLGPGGSSRAGVLESDS